MTMNTEPKNKLVLSSQFEYLIVLTIVEFVKSAVPLTDT